MSIVKYVESFLFMVLFLGLAYYVGYIVGQNKSLDIKKLELAQQERINIFNEHRDQSCLAWWFDDSASRIRDAQVFMCQNKKKWTVSHEVAVGDQ